MKNWQFGIFAALLVGNIMVTAVPILDPARTQPQWEYMIEAPKDETFANEINKSGAVGWELVFARRAIGEGKQAGYELIYKRPRD